LLQGEVEHLGVEGNRLLDVVDEVPDDCHRRPAYPPA
jgi:hypothetical protein